MERIPNGLYTAEFRAEAVKWVETTGMSVGRAAKQRSIPKISLDSWVRAARTGKLGEVGQGRRPPSELEVELARTQKELAEVNYPAASGGAFKCELHKHHFNFKMLNSF